MRFRSFDLLGPAGVLLAAGCFIADRLGKPLPGGLQPYLIGAAAAVLAHLLLRGEDIARAIGVRQLRYGANAAVYTLVVAAILGAANYLTSRHTKRWDLTKNQRYSLSDQTKKVLGGLQQDVTILYFQRAGEPGGQDRMKDYQALSPRIKVEYVDPVANPARAQAYEARGPYPMLVVERGSRRERITNDSEQDVTNAVIKVTREGKKTVCFAEGEGERDIDDSSERGLAQARAALGKAQYETKKLLLARDKQVPAECTVLVVAGPEKDPLPPVLDAVRGWVKAGGKALLMVEPEFQERYPNLVALAAEWNLQVGPDVVVDASGMGQLFGTGPITPIAAQYPYHEITKDMRGMMTLFHAARSVRAGAQAPSGVSSGNLVETSPASWAESDLALKDPIDMDPSRDGKGPVSLGAWATLAAPSPTPAPAPSPSPAASPAPEASPVPEETKPPEARVVVMGDADYASNALLGVQGNEDFFLNTVAWLAQDTDLISIRPKEPEDQRMFLTGNQQLLVVLLALVVLPGAFVVLGIGAWWRRR